MRYLKAILFLIAITAPISATFAGGHCHGEGADPVAELRALNKDHLAACIKANQISAKLKKATDKKEIKILKEELKKANEKVDQASDDLRYFHINNK